MNRAANISIPASAGILPADPVDSGVYPTSIIPQTDEFSEEVARAQAQLAVLRRRQDEIQLQKDELERLRKKQSSFQSARSELISDFEHALEVLERNLLESEQLMENYSRTRECFNQHLVIISSLRSEDWNREQLENELDRAADSIDEARHEYDQAVRHLDRLAQDHSKYPAISSGSESINPFENKGQGTPPATRNFLYWLRSGFAFTLPIMIFGIISFLILTLFN